MVLVDGVSLPANKVRKALRDLDKDAKKAKGAMAGAGVHIPGEGPTAGGLIAGGGRALLGGAAAYFGAQAMAGAYTDAAGFDRRLTYILNTAGEGRKEMGRLRETIYRVAQDAAAPVAKVTEGMESLIAAGRDMPDAIAFLPAVTRTAQAAGAEVLDLAKTADAFGTSFRIAGGDMEKAFDAALYLGKKGKFELKDQARYLPSILPMAGTRGLKGLEGLNKVIAALQVIRQNSGTSEEAATAITDVLGKLDSPETVKAMKKNFGVDLPKALQKARKEGKNTFDAFLDIVELAVKGDLEKVNKIFQDKEARRGLVALMQYRDQYRGLQSDARNAVGEVGRDIKTVTEDAQAGIDRLSNSWDKFKTSMGNTAAASGGVELLDRMSKGLDEFTASLDRYHKARAQGKGVFESLIESDPQAKAVLDAGHRVQREQAAKDTLADKMFKATTLRDTVFAQKAQFDMLVGKYDERRNKPNKTASEIKTLQAWQVQLERMRAELVALNDQYEAAKREVDAAAGDVIENALLMDPTQQAPDIQTGDFVPLPPRKPSAPGAPMGRDQRAKVSVGVDEASVMAAADEIRRKTQAYVNANPITIPVRAGDVSGAMGRAVTNGMAGAQSDVAPSASAR